MTITFIILVILGLTFLIKFFVSKASKNDATENEFVLPALPVKTVNDKIVVIKGANYPDIKKAVQQFCKLYNQNTFTAIPNLTRVSEQEFVITFPHDISFDVFCFFINYLHYPENIQYMADIKAWLTTKQTDIWLTDKLANKQLMVFIPADDQNYDNVIATTQENICYVLDFGSEEIKILDLPQQKFIPQTRTFEYIKGFSSEEIK